MKSIPMYVLPSHEAQMVSCREDSYNTTLGRADAESRWQKCCCYEQHSHDLMHQKCIHLVQFKGFTEEHHNQAECTLVAPLLLRHG